MLPTNVNPNSVNRRQVVMRPDGRCFVLPTSTQVSMSNGTNEYDEQPVSRTYQYRKVMKPMLERKRRARINRCLDELKELMLTALQSEGENVSKLEKADILELTVRHLHKLKRQRALGLNNEPDRFLAGFAHCAAEVSQYMASLLRLQNASTEVPAELSIDQSSGVRLLHHLQSCIQRIETSAYRRDETYSNTLYTPPSSPSSPSSPNFTSFSSSDSSQSGSPPPASVWRPW